MYIILIASLLPVFLLIIYVYANDRYQKEPFTMILKALFAGALAGILDVILLTVTGLSGIKFYDPLVNSAYTAFGLAGLPEELCKFFMLYLFIWKSKYFDEYYDGVEYGACIGLGFAGLENISYVMQYGLQVAIPRALFAVPAHFFFGIIMGYFFAFAKFRPWHRKRYLLIAIFLPAVLHGIYDFLLMYNAVLENQTTAYIIYGAWFVFFFLIFRFAKGKLKKLVGK